MKLSKPMGRISYRWSGSSQNTQISELKINIPRHKTVRYWNPGFRKILKSFKVRVI